MPRKKKVHKNGTRVTISKAALSRVVSLGAAHKSALADLRATVGAATKRKAKTSKKGRKKTGKKRGKKTGKKRVKRAK